MPVYSVFADSLPMIIEDMYMSLSTTWNTFSSHFYVKLLILLIGKHSWKFEKHQKATRLLARVLTAFFFLLDVYFYELTETQK